VIRFFIFFLQKRIDTILMTVMDERES